MRTKTLEHLRKKKLIAIIRGVKKDDCLNLAQALLNGGISMMEITFDQRSQEALKNTTDAISAIASKFEGQIYVGAGTVMNSEQVMMAAEAGAQYIISPDTNEKVIRKTLNLGLVSLPGAMTPTEIAFAHDCGADCVKVFPAGVLGPAYIRAIRAPLSHIDLLGVGGITTSNVVDFLKAGCIGFGVGGNLVNKAWIEAGEYEKITKLAKEFSVAAGK